MGRDKRRGKSKQKLNVEFSPDKSVEQLNHEKFTEILRENRAIKARISAWTNKQEKLKNKQIRIQENQAKKIE